MYIELRPMTLTYEVDLDMVKMNRQAIHLGHWSFRSKVIIVKHTHTRARAGARVADQLLCMTTKWSKNKKSDPSHSWSTEDTPYALVLGHVHRVK